VKRRILLALMLAVTAWGTWAFAQGHGNGHGPVAEPPPPGGHLVETPGKEGAGKEEEAPAPINWTQFGTETPPYIAMLVNFGILVAGYYLLGRKPIAAGLQSRRDRIAQEIEDAQKMRREAEARAKLYQGKLEKLEDEVRIAREGLVRAGEAERDRIVLEAEAKGERMRKDAQFLVEQELKQIRLDLQRETVEAAITAAEELLKKRVTMADHERLAEDYLSDLGGKPARPSIAAPGKQENAT
jgi:F-type H+-transporting ATPase subunit b